MKKNHTLRFKLNSGDTYDVVFFFKFLKEYEERYFEYSFFEYFLKLKNETGLKEPWEDFDDIEIVLDEEMLKKAEIKYKHYLNKKKLKAEDNVYINLDSCSLITIIDNCKDYIEKNNEIPR